MMFQVQRDGPRSLGTKISQLPTSAGSISDGGADYVRPGAGLVARAHEIFGWIASGQLKVHIHKEYRLSDAAAAHRDIGGRNTIGKLLLVP